jgi:integrase
MNRLMGRPRKDLKDKTLKEWLTLFKKKSTKNTYLTGLRHFKQNLGIEDLSKYLESTPNAAINLRKFLNSLDGKPSKTIAVYTAAVKMFFQDHKVKLEDNDWRKLRRRGFMPKRVKAQTRDKKPTKTQLKQILNYADIKGRALFLFLVSSGARIGETLQLLIEDFNLEAGPPRVHIRGEYTKGGVGERTVYFSYEARDAIKDWLRIKDGLGRRNGGTYED